MENRETQKISNWIILIACLALLTRIIHRFEFSVARGAIFG